MWCYSGVEMRAVIDTNVLFEGLTHLGPAAGVVDAWVARRFQPCVSTALALEYEDVLSHRIGPARAETVLKALQALLVRCSFVPIRYSYRPASPDPGDDLVIDCVLNGQAALVTFNVRDFREPSERLGFLLLRPADFLELLAGNTP